MRECPVPVVMVSTKTQKGAKVTLDALQLGAVDYVAKPLVEKSATLESFPVLRPAITPEAGRYHSPGPIPL